MAQATVDRKARVGEHIMGESGKLFFITKVLKHAYKVTDDKGVPQADIWSFDTYRNSLGFLVSRKN